MAHIHQAIDFTVGAFIVHRQRVLLVHHNQLNSWLAVGGHIELNEDPEQALFREIKEEAGISRKDLTILAAKPDISWPGTKTLYAPAFMDIHAITPSHRHIVLVYFLKSNIADIRLKASEHRDIRWVKRGELDSLTPPLWPAIKFYALEAFRRAEQELPLALQ